jgi:hypothetical protein
VLVVVVVAPNENGPPARCGSMAIWSALARADHLLEHVPFLRNRNALSILSFAFLSANRRTLRRNMRWDRTLHRIGLAGME